MHNPMDEDNFRLNFIIDQTTPIIGGDSNDNNQFSIDTDDDDNALGSNSSQSSSSSSSNGSVGGDSAVARKSFDRDEQERKERNDRINNLLYNNLVDYDRVPSIVKDWIKQDQEEEAKLNSDIPLDNETNNNNINMECNNSPMFDCKLIENLPQDIKFEIIDFIPTFSKRRQLDTKRSDRKSDEYIVDEEELVSFIEEMNQLLHWDEKRLQNCLMIRDVPLKTMHKMRIISKEYAKRMKFKLMTLSHLDIPLALSKKGLCYFSSFLKAQQVYHLVKKENDHSKEDDFLIYKDLPLIHEDDEEADDGASGGEDLLDMDNFSEMYDCSSMEMVYFIEYLDPDENELPATLIEFVGSNTVVTSVKTLGRPNVMNLILSTCKNLKHFTSCGKIVDDTVLTNVEHWTCEFFTGPDHQLEDEIETVCKVAPNVKRIDMIYSSERRKDFKQDFLDDIEIAENTKIVVEGCVNKTIPAPSGKCERCLEVSLTHLESEDEKTILQVVQYYQIDDSYLFNLLYSGKYISLEKRKSLANALFKKQKDQEMFPIEMIKFDESIRYEEQFDTLFAYTVYLCNEYQNGILFKFNDTLDDDIVGQALEFGWRPGKWDELLLVKSDFTTSQIEKLLALIRYDYQNDINFFQYLRLLLNKNYSTNKQEYIDWEKKNMRAMVQYLKKNQSLLCNTLGMEILFKPFKTYVSKHDRTIVQSSSINVPFISMFSIDIVSLITLVDICPSEFFSFQNENGDTLLHVLLFRLRYDTEKLVLVDHVIKKCPYLLNVLNKQNRSPVHIAFSTENSDFIRMLGMYDLDLQQKDCSGNTPLDYLTEDYLKDYFE